MSDFTYSPSYASQLSREPRTLTAKFGDGYEQRVGDGINKNPQAWQLTFDNRGNTDAAAIMTFLDGKAAVTAFTWTPPDGVQITVVSRKWNRTYSNGNNNTVTCTFEQVFE